MAAGIGGIAILQPLPTALVFVTIMIIAYATTLAHRVWLMGTALRNDATVYVPDEVARALPDHELPVYTVLVPAYREPEVVSAVVASMAALEYPADRLEVLLLLEEDDTDTIAAAGVACAGTAVQVVLVPPGEPRTKPKACNYGLMMSTGEFVTIYDAEDHPEPLQLRRAVVAFRQSGPDVACLQGRLSYHNADQNLITRWFTTEYDTWFRWLLPGLCRDRRADPVGGHVEPLPPRRCCSPSVAGTPTTSPRTPTSGCAWPGCGFGVAVLESTTLEEANSDFVNWVKQRSRWYKGYLQTVLVHTRAPRRLLNELGLRQTIGFLLFVGGTPLLAMLNPVFWGLTLLWWLDRPRSLPPCSRRSSTTSA